MRGIKLIVAVAVTMLAASATASAACDLTISNGPQSGITEGPTGTFTSTADSAVLDVGTLEDRLSVGNANVNVGTVSVPAVGQPDRQQRGHLVDARTR